MLTTAVVAERFFSFPCIRYESALTTQAALFVSLQKLTHDYVPNDIVSRCSSWYKDFWRSQEERRQQESYLLDISRLIANSIDILKQAHEYVSDEQQGEQRDRKLTPDAKKIIYLAFNREPKKGNGVEEWQVSSDVMGLRQEAKALQKRLSADAARPDSAAEKLITLPRTKTLLGGVTAATTLWGLAIQAGLLVVSGPLVVFGVPCLIGASILLLKVADGVFSDKRNAKTDCLLEFDAQVLSPFIKSLDDMLFEIFNKTQQIFSSNQQIQQDLNKGASVLNNISSNTQQIPQIRADLNEGVFVLNSIANNAHEIFSNTETIQRKLDKTQADMQVGVEALNKIAEAQTRIEQKVDNQQPAIVVNLDAEAMKQHRLLMGQYLDAVREGLLSTEQFLALSAKTSSTLLQLTDVPSGANESQYLKPRQRTISGISMLSVISEGSSSTSPSRSSTPPTDYSDTGTPPSSQKYLSLPEQSTSSSKGKGKAPATLTLVINADDDDETVLQKTREQRRLANLHAA